MQIYDYRVPKSLIMDRIYIHNRDPFGSETIGLQPIREILLQDIQG